MLEATFVGKLEAEAEAVKSRGSATLTVNANVGDAKLKASVINALAPAPSFTFSLEKPESFSVNYSPEEGGLPNLKVKLMDSVKVTGRKVNWAYSHALREKKTTVDGSVELNAENKVAVSHVLGTEDCKLRYTFARPKLPVVEPAYDLKDRAWAVAVSKKFDGGDAVRGKYEAKNRKLEMEWSRTFRDKGSFKAVGRFARSSGKIYLGRGNENDLRSFDRDDLKDLTRYQDEEMITKDLPTISASFTKKDQEIVRKFMAESTWSCNL